jgi:hypothetical protein
MCRGALVRHLSPKAVARKQKQGPIRGCVEADHSEKLRLWRALKDITIA